MTTAATVKLTQYDNGVFNNGLKADSAEAASRLLQQNHEQFHMYFNDEGFHNHISHHLFSSYALGADPESLQKSYDRNASYQRPVLPVNEAVVNELADRASFRKYLNQEEHFANYLEYFQRELDAKGVESTLNEHLFAGDEHAEDLLVRTFAGFLHPLIHLGFGLEFNQLAIIAEALAQAATHDKWIGDYLLPAEKAAGGVGTERSQKTIVQLVEDCRDDTVLRQSVLWSDGQKVRDGIMKRAPNEMLKYASQYTASAENLDEHIAEMIDAIVYITAAAQRPDKEVKMDFFLMHGTNCSIFYPTFIKLPWLSERNKVRLLEWKVRMDLALYVSRGSPKLLIDEITSYPIKKDWRGVFNEGITNPGDDGHIVKMMRAVALGETFCKPFESKGIEGGFVIREDAWLKIGNMIADSTSGGLTRWVRSTGFDEAWEKLRDRANL